MVFLVVLFLLKNGLLFENITNFTQNRQANGLVYDENTTIKDLITKDTDGDGIPDWEEALYGLDPTKKETTPGIPDITAFNKLAATRSENSENTNGETKDEKPLTKTEQLSRELFATVAAVAENGQSVNQTTVETISDSLTNGILNSPQRKIYALADLKTTNNNTVAAVQKYSNSLTDVYKKYPDDIPVEDVLAKFVGDGTAVDESALAELGPIIKQMQNIINDWLKMTVPSQLATAHLGTINMMEGVLENVSDIQLYDTDPMTAIGAIKNYKNNIFLLESAFDARNNAINQKLKS